MQHTPHRLLGEIKGKIDAEYKTIVKRLTFSLLKLLKNNLFRFSFVKDLSCTLTQMPGDWLGDTVLLVDDEDPSRDK